MTKTDIWMPLYIGDYLSDTSHLTAEQSGAYLHLLMHYWKTGPLPNSDQALAQISRLSMDAWSIAQAVLRPFFTVNGDGRLHQKRVDAELVHWNAKKLSAKEKSSKASKVRWKKHASSIPSSIPSSSPQAMLGSCPSPSPSPIKTNTLARFASSDIERIYEAYPRKIGRGKALLAIRKALEREIANDDPVKALLDKTAEFARSPAGQNGSFTPHPATWFNQGRFFDDPEEWEKVSK